MSTGPSGDAGHDDDRQGRERPPEEHAGQRPHLVAPPAVEAGDEGRDEHGEQQPAGQQLEQDVRDEVGPLVGVAERGDAERARGGHHPHEPGGPGQQVEPGDRRRPAGDGPDRAALDPATRSRQDERGLGVGQLVHAQLESGGSWVRPSP